MKKLILLTCLFTLVSCSSKSTFKIIGSAEDVSTAAIQKGSPLEFYIKIQRAWLLPNADCLPEEGKELESYIIQNRKNFEEKNLNVNPVLFEGKPEAGTYNCLILEMKDTMKFTPDEEAAETHSGCKLNNYYYFDVFGTTLGEGVTFYDPIQKEQIAPKGTPQANRERYEGTDNQNAYLYVTTNLDQINSDVHPYQTLTLTEELVITEEDTQELTFIVDTKDKVTLDMEECSIDKPTMTIN